MSNKIYSILVEKVDNGYIVKENYRNCNPGTIGEMLYTKVFESTENLNNYITENMSFESKNPPIAKYVDKKLESIGTQRTEQNVSADGKTEWERVVANVKKT